MKHFLLIGAGVILLAMLGASYAYRNPYTVYGNLGITAQGSLIHYSGNRPFLDSVTNPEFKAFPWQSQDQEQQIGFIENSFNKAVMGNLSPNIDVGILKNFGWMDDYLYIGLQGSYIPTIFPYSFSLDARIVNSTMNTGNFQYGMLFNTDIYSMMVLFGGSPHFYSAHPKMTGGQWDLNLGFGGAIMHLRNHHHWLNGTITQDEVDYVNDNLSAFFPSTVYGVSMGFTAKRIFFPMKNHKYEPYLFLKSDIYMFFGSTFPVVIDTGVGLGMNMNIG